MTDGLINLAPLWDAVGVLVEQYGGYLGVILGVYLGLFVLGLIIESVRSAKKGGA